MTWRSNPPSQYVDVNKVGVRVPLWALALISIICLALGITAGLTLRDDGDQVVDPLANGPMQKREELVTLAHQELAALTQLDAATNIKGAPTSFGLVTLGKEERDVCVTGQHGFKVHDWYSSACGVQVTWYLAAKHGSPATLDAAAEARFKGRRIPTVSSFTWTEDSGPLPSKLSGEVHAQRAGSGSTLDDFQHATHLRFPEQNAVYHDTVRTFDLATAYRDHGGKRRNVVRLSLLAQYSWT